MITVWENYAYERVSILENRPTIGQLVLSGLIKALAIFDVYLKFFDQNLTLGINRAFSHLDTHKIIADR